MTLSNRLVRNILLVNVVVWFLFALAGLVAAKGTGLLIGGAAFNGALIAYFVHRHSRLTALIHGVDA